MNKLVSVIVVNYKVRDLLFDCLESIYKKTKNNNFEIIVVDNDERKTIFPDLRKRFPQVKYVPNKNRGFAQGNNKGAKIAQGKYLFFLNPDTKFLNDVVKSLIEYINDNEDVGIVAPILYDKKERSYDLQGFGELNPRSAIFALSFINKLFPNNGVSKKYWLAKWNKKKIKKVDIVPGSALMIRRELFKKIGGFDENFFLYFEEMDLCKRVKDLGYKIALLPNAKVVHNWGESTKKSERNLTEIFRKSRQYYFKKHFGFLSAIFVEFFLRINRNNLALLGVLILGLFLTLDRISTLMPFIGDQGWFYLSARDLALGKSFPLVGIASSHPWLHQGVILDIYTCPSSTNFWIQSHIWCLFDSFHRSIICYFSLQNRKRICFRQIWSNYCINLYNFSFSYISPPNAISYQSYSFICSASFLFTHKVGKRKNLLFSINSFFHVCSL